MKKLFALVLTLALALSLTACGGSKEETPADEGGETGEETVDYTTMSDDELKAAITLSLDHKSRRQQRIV